MSSTAEGIEALATPADTNVLSEEQDEEMSQTSVSTPECPCPERPSGGRIHLHEEGYGKENLSRTVCLGRAAGLNSSPLLPRGNDCRLRRRAMPTHLVWLRAITVTTILGAVALCARPAVALPPGRSWAATEWVTRPEVHEVFADRFATNHQGRPRLVL